MYLIGETVNLLAATDSSLPTGTYTPAWLTRLHSRFENRIDSKANFAMHESVVDEVWHCPLIDGKRVRQRKHPGFACSVARDPEAFYRTMYCTRGEMENRIKEQQLCLFADRTSCTKFIANLFHLASHSPSEAIFNRVLLRICRSD